MEQEIISFFDKLNERLWEFIPHLIAACVILVLGYYLAKILAKSTRNALFKIAGDETLSRFFGKVVFVAVLIIIFISALSNLGIQTTSILAALGAAGLAIALSLKNSLGNLASGLLIIILRPFKQGDSVDFGGFSGRVAEISLFNTRIITPDNKEIIIPNSNITSKHLINISATPTRRIELRCVVVYGSDVARVKQIILQICLQQDLVLKDPAPLIGVSNLGDLGVEFLVRIWTKREHTLHTQMAVLEAIKIAFDEVGITFAINQA